MSQDWESVPPDPDLHDDLGYDLRPLKVQAVDPDADEYIFLPRECDHEESDEFIIADADSVMAVLDMW